MKFFNNLIEQIWVGERSTQSIQLWYPFLCMVVMGEYKKNKYFYDHCKNEELKPLQSDEAVVILACSFPTWRLWGQCVKWSWARLHPRAKSENKQTVIDIKQWPNTQPWHVQHTDAESQRQGHTQRQRQRHTHSNTDTIFCLYANTCPGFNASSQVVACMQLYVFIGCITKYIKCSVLSWKEGLLLLHWECGC